MEFIGDDSINWCYHWRVEQKNSHDIDDDPKKVFDKYYREVKESKGVGIGLFIVSQIAQLHHLTIEVDSTLGVGTTFKIACHPISTLTLHTSTV